ncbi:MAG: hypothetical protein QM610_00130 [Chitinophagaceae bacterium]
MSYKYLFLFCGLAIFSKNHAQVFGGNPSSTQWKQLGNDTFNIVFPSYRIQSAREVASLLQWESRYNTNIGDKVRRVNIVLQPDVTYSNGYVGLGPFRSEFYLMPPTDPFALGSQNWASNLAVHEYRHVQQYNNFNVGLSRAVGMVFGENGRALFNAMSVPDWFFEGDAVYNETKLSQQGRGRLPLFMNDFAALLRDNKKYSYQKIRNGSYRDYVPNHYALGYILVAYGYEKYGLDFWKKVTRDASAFTSLVYPFQAAVKKYAGVDFTTFVDNAFDYYRQSMPNGNDSTIYWTKKHNNDIVNYTFPSVAENGIVALKDSRRAIPRFVQLDSAGEKKIAVQSISYDDYFSTNGKEIIYSSLQSDRRWGNRQYSVVRILDKVSKKEIKVASKTKWFTPDICPTGDSLLVVENKNDALTSRVLLLNRKGDVLKTFNNDSTLFSTYPKFYRNGFYVFVRDKKGWMSIRYYTFDTDGYKIVVPGANRLLGYPNLQNDTLFFSCSANGKDALWAYNAVDEKVVEVATFPTGVYGGGNVGNKTVGSVFTSEGNRIAQLQPVWQPVSELSADTLQLLYFDDLKAANPILDKLSADTTLTEKKYRKFTHPFNFHSVQPDWDDPVYSVSFYGENILNTVQSQLYYNYNRNEKYSSVGLSTVYGGWYVMPVFNVSETFNRQAQASNGVTMKWNELNGNVGLRLPLNFTGGKLYRYLTLQSTVNTNYIQWQGVASRYFYNRNFNYWSNQLSFSVYSQQASQQLYPHFGLSVSTLYRTGFTEKAYQWLTVGNLYLPGLLPTHSIVLNGAYMMRDTLGNYSFSNGFPISRGYSSINYPRMWKLGANYHFPIVYPDWGLGNLVYFLRIRGNAFYDYSSLKSLRYQTTYHLRSVGGEIYFDTKWWNQETVTFGVRYSNMIDHKLLRTGANRWEFILPISIW